MGWENIINEKEYSKAITSINQWYLKGIKLLNIITVPHNSTLIFSSVINEIAKKQGRVLYIHGHKHINKELVNHIKLINTEYTYQYVSKGEGLKNLNFTSFDDITEIKGFYDLCIIDDISTFSHFSMDKLRALIEYMYLYSSKIITFSIERAIAMGQKLDLSVLNSNKPFVEPRIITTRIDLNKDIPYSLYDYLLWFKETRKKIVIFVPNDELVKETYELYKKLLKLKGNEITTLMKNEDTKKIVNLTKIKDRVTFIVTSTFGEYLSDIKRMDSIILSAEDRHFTYKNIVYLCGEVGKESELLGEVLLVTNQETHQIERAKWITRDFNKKSWEKGFIKK